MTAHIGPSQQSIATMKRAVNDSFRKIYLNNDAENERLRRELHYAGNHVSTSKYSLVRCVCASSYVCTVACE